MVVLNRITLYIGTQPGLLGLREKSSIHSVEGYPLQVIEGKAEMLYKNLVLLCNCGIEEEGIVRTHRIPVAKGHEAEFGDH